MFPLDFCDLGTGRSFPFDDNFFVELKGFVLRLIVCLAIFWFNVVVGLLERHSCYDFLANPVDWRWRDHGFDD